MKRKAVEQPSRSPTRIKYCPSEEEEHEHVIIPLDLTFSSERLKHKLSISSHSNITPKQQLLFDSIYEEIKRKPPFRPVNTKIVHQNLLELELCGFDFWVRRPTLTELQVIDRQSLMTRYGNRPSFVGLLIMFKLWDYYKILMDHSTQCLERIINCSRYNFMAYMPQLSYDREMVLLSVKKREANIQFVSDVLINDKIFVLQIVKENANTFKYLPEILRNDLEIIIEAVKKNEDNYDYIANQSLKNDRETILKLVSVNGQLISRISNKFRDREMYLTAVSQSESLFPSLPYDLTQDRSFVLQLVSLNGRALSYVGSLFQNDKEIVLMAVSQYGLALEFASNEMKNDKEVVTAALKRHSTAFVSEKLRKVTRNQDNEVMNLH